MSENYYPGWQATVDGRAAALGRADYALIGVELPTGARQVELTFRSHTYQVGKLVTLLALACAVALWVGGAVVERRTRG